MMFKGLFSKKSNRMEAVQRTHSAGPPPAESLHLDALDACVGGRDDTHSVACYLRSNLSQPS